VTGPSLSTLGQATDDALGAALQLLVMRDLLDASAHLMEDTGWAPLTVAYAQRLRDVQTRFGLWPEEPDLVREVLDGSGR
jgi:hypothetical protein